MPTSASAGTAPEVSPLVGQANARWASEGGLLLSPVCQRGYQSGFLSQGLPSFKRLFLSGL